MACVSVGWRTRDVLLFCAGLVASFFRFCADVAGMLKMRNAGETRIADWNKYGNKANCTSAC